MPTLRPAEGIILERILQSTCAHGSEGLTAAACRRFDAAQTKSAWGRDHRQRVALIEGAELLASAVRYDLDAVLDQRPVRVCGIGALFTAPTHQDRGYERTLLRALSDAAADDGADLLLLFADHAAPWARESGFEAVSMIDVELRVTESTRHGAPMTPLRVGEPRDLAAIAAMGRIRAAPFRFHLDRGVEFVQHAITRQRLLAGFAPLGARQLQFFIAEEGITAAAYLVLSVTANTWTIAECGDRDPSGARVGAILQGLIARQPVESRPAIRGWLPPGFVPPQVSIVSATPAAQTMLVRSLHPGSSPLQLSAADVLYWLGDRF